MGNSLSAHCSSKVWQTHVQLIWLSYICICFQNLFSWHISGIDQIFRYVIALSLICSIDFSRWDRFKFFLALFLLISLILRRLLIVWTLFCFIYQIDYYKISINKLARLGLAIICLTLFIQIEGILIGFFENNAVKYLKSDSFTYDLGTGNANRCASLFFKIILLSYIILTKNKRLLFIVFALTIALISYVITASRTPLACSILIVIVAIAYWKNYIPKWICYFVAILPLILFITTFYFALNFEDNQSLNDVASGRLWYILKFTREFTLKEWLIGAPRTVDDPLDSAYLEIVHTGGILLAGFLSIVFLKTTITFYSKILIFLPIVIPLLIGGLTESILLQPSEVSIILWVIMFQSVIRYKPNFN